MLAILVPFLAVVRCEYLGTHIHESCVSLVSPDSTLNRHICEEMGMLPCVSESGVCDINPKVISEAFDRETCLKTLFGFFSTIACVDMKVKEYIYRGVDGFTTVYVSKELSNLLWRSCSKRARMDISDILEEDESKRFCKNLTMEKSKVRIRQAINLPGLTSIPIFKPEQVAEVNWLIGGPIDFNLIKLKLSGIIIIFVVIILALSSLYLRHEEVKGRLLKESLTRQDVYEDNLVELDLNF